MYQADGGIAYVRISLCTTTKVEALLRNFYREWYVLTRGICFTSLILSAFDNGSSGLNWHFVC